MKISSNCLIERSSVLGTHMHLHCFQFGQTELSKPLTKFSMRFGNYRQHPFKDIVSSEITFLLQQKCPYLGQEELANLFY